MYSQLVRSTGQKYLSQVQVTSQKYMGLVTGIWSGDSFVGLSPKLVGYAITPGRVQNELKDTQLLPGELDNPLVWGENTPTFGVTSILRNRIFETHPFHFKTWDLKGGE